MLLSSPIDIFKNSDPETIAHVLSEYDDAYFRGEPMVSDETYDMLRGVFEKRYPSHPYHKKVGHDDVGRKKVMLPYPMGSLVKLAPYKGQILSFFHNRRDDNILITDKLDGMSALVTYSYDPHKKTKHVRLYTRGNGSTGQDISHLVKYIKGVEPYFDHNYKSARDEHTVAIRGELILPRHHLDNMRYKGYSNLRNLVAGLINARHPDPVLLKLVHFVAYSVLKPSGLAPSEQMVWLSERHMPHIVHFESLDTHDIDENDESTWVTKLSSILARRKEASSYEIDGLVISHDVPAASPSSFAYKYMIMQDQAEVIVKDVHWQLNRNGLLKPVVQFEPVRIDQVMVKRATAFHAQYVLHNKIGIGARLLVRRSGQVIPNIVRVIKGADAPTFPVDHPFYWRGVDISIREQNDHRTASSSQEKEHKLSPELENMLNLKKLEHFFEVNKVEHLSQKRIEKLFVAGWDDVNKILFRVSRQDLYSILGLYGYKIHDGLVKKRTFIPAPALLHGSGAFGNNDIGQKTFEILVHRFPRILFDARYIPDTSELLDIDGISKKKAESFVQGLATFREMQAQDKLPKFYEKEEEKEPSSSSASRSSSGPLRGHTLLFSGFRNRELEADLVNLGANIATSMNKNVTILLVPNKGVTTQKTKHAQEKGIQIMEVPDLFRIMSQSTSSTRGPPGAAASPP